jgi:hypothetical protein
MTTNALETAMAEHYDEATAQFPKGTAVYFGSQVWTVGMEFEGLAQITRGDRTRYIATADLRAVTAEDEFRGAAFAYLDH